MAIIGISGKIGSGKDTAGLIIQYLTDEYAKRDGLIFQQWMEEYININVGYDVTASKWEIKKFADALKDIVCILTGCTREQLEDITFKNSKLGDEWTKLDDHGNHITVGKRLNSIDTGDVMTYRELLQYVGTDLFRNQLHSNTWVNALFSKYDNNFHAVNFSVRQGIKNPEYPSWIITDVRFPNEANGILDRNGIVIRINRKSEIEKWSKFDIDGFHEYPKEHKSETALDDYTFDYVIDNNGTIDDLINNIKDILVARKTIF